MLYLDLSTYTYRHYLMMKLNTRVRINFFKISSWRSSVWQKNVFGFQSKLFGQGLLMLPKSSDSKCPVPKKCHAKEKFPKRASTYKWLLSKISNQNQPKISSYIWNCIHLGDFAPTHYQWRWHWNKKKYPGYSLLYWKLRQFVMSV